MLFLLAQVDALHCSRAIECYVVFKICTIVPNRAESIIRCPYCKVGNEFRPMAARIEGWLQCENCGHNAMPLDPEFKCCCSKCGALQSPRRAIEIPDAE